VGPGTGAESTGLIRVRERSSGLAGARGRFEDSSFDVRTYHTYLKRLGSLSYYWRADFMMLGLFLGIESVVSFLATSVHILGPVRL
jgi:hypothetical protein